MHKIMTLVNIEINRILKFLAGIIGLYVICQTIFTLVMINIQERKFADAAKQSGVTIGELVRTSAANWLFIDGFVKNRAASVGGVLVCALILIYGLIIWYREWLGNNKVIYTLMMLPTDRMKMYISKFVTMLLLIFSMLAAFVIVQATNYMLIINMLSKYSEVDISFMNFIYNNGYLSFILVDPLEFLIYVSEIFTVIALIFLFVHMEISFRIKGAVFGIILASAYMAILYKLFSSSRILIMDKMIAITFFNIIVSGVSAAVSNFILRNKIRV